MDDLRLREDAIFNYIKKVIKQRGYPPTVREIGSAVGLKSSSTVHGYLNELEKKGYIKRDPGTSRAIEVLHNEYGFGPEKETVNVPLVGRITAGEPILAQEAIEDVFPLPYDLVGGETTFMLTVQGESMIGAGIMDGDLLVVKKQNYAENGEIVVALLEDEATVKRFFKEKDTVRLQPENPSMQPIFSRDVTILGRVVALIRQY